MLATSRARGVLTVFLVAVAFVAQPSAIAATPDDVALKNLPAMRRRSYQADPYIAAASKLQELGEEKAIEILRRAAKGPDQNDSKSVIVLCRMLFTAKPKGTFRQPMLGGPYLPGGTQSEDWSLVPLEIVDGVPFLVVEGYVLSGFPEPSAYYLDYCLKECDWASTKFKPKTAAERNKALEKLLASPKWTQPLTDNEKAFLSKQISPD